MTCWITERERYGLIDLFLPVICLDYCTGNLLGNLAKYQCTTSYTGLRVPGVLCYEFSTSTDKISGISNLVSWSRLCCSAHSLINAKVGILVVGIIISAWVGYLRTECKDAKWSKINQKRFSGNGIIILLCSEAYVIRLMILFVCCSLISTMRNSNRALMD